MTEQEVIKNLKDEIKLQEGLVAYFRDLWIKDRIELEHLREEAKISLQELKQTEDRLDEVATILGKTVSAFKSDSFVETWDKLPERVTELLSDMKKLEEGLLKYKPVWHGADHFPPKCEELTNTSENVLMNIPFMGIPVIAYYNFNTEYWYDLNSETKLYPDEYSEWTSLPVKEKEG